MPWMPAALLVALVRPDYAPKGPKLQVILSSHRSFTITTDKSGSPKTVQAILRLVKSGFYDGLKVHRVERWVVQWGDPQSKKLSIGDTRLGAKSSGLTLPFEPSKVSFLRGVVGIASSYTGVGGDGQLFILTKDALRLNGGYGVLGKVTEGMEVVDRIKLGDRIVQVKVLK